MATWILCNCVKFNQNDVGPLFLSAGDTIDDTKQNLSQIQAAGGVVVASSDAIVAAAQVIALKRRKGGAPTEELDRLMLAASAQSLRNAAQSLKTSTSAAGATVAAAAAIVPNIVFTSKSSTKVKIKFWASAQGLGAGATFTPVVKQATTTIAAPAQYTGAATTFPYNVVGEVYATVVVGTASTFSFVSTAGDGTVTLGNGATGIAASMTVEEVPL
jgi:hypothetical protein